MLAIPCTPSEAASLGLLRRAYALETAARDLRLAAAELAMSLARTTPEPSPAVPVDPREVAPTLPAGSQRHIAVATSQANQPANRHRPNEVARASRPAKPASTPRPARRPSIRDINRLFDDAAGQRR